MTEIETRAFDFEVRLQDVEARTVTGLAVPYGQTINIGGFQERIAPGAFGKTQTMPLFWGHDHKEIPIGRVVATRETDAGLEIDAIINDTDKGNNVYRALKAGDITKFSVGFVPTKNRREGDVVIRESAELKEVSLVNFPAYSLASVTEVRAEQEMENIMENDYSTDIEEIRGSVNDLVRKFDKAEADKPEAFVSQYRSAGEWLAGLAKGESNAKDIATRDFGTLADADGTSRPAFVDAQLKLVEKQRIIKNLFSTAPLPAAGNSIEYPRVKQTAGTVQKQAAEGANLAYLEVALETATSPVETYGGYSSLSRQAIERSDLSYLETVLRFQALAYADATEFAVQQALVGAVGVNEVELVGATAASYLGAVLDAKAEIDDNSRGLAADFVLVSRDVHRTLSTLLDTTGRPVFDINGDGSNTFGTIPAGRLAGVIDGTPIVIGKNLPAGTIVVASASALVTYEAPGAPFRLQDENIINLTKDFSLYGYMAIAIPDVKGITVISDGA